MYWNLIANVIVLGSGAFGSWLDHEGGALVNGFTILFFIKENPQSSLAPSTMWAYREKMDAYEPGSRPLQTPDLWTSWSWTSRLQKCEKYVSVAYKPQSMVFCYHCPNGLRQLDCLEAEIEAEIWCLWFWGRACQEKPLRIVKGKLLSKAMVSRQV